MTRATALQLQGMSIPTSAWPNPAPRYNSHMGCTYSPMDYADPDAVTQIANGLSTSTFSYDNNGNLTQKTVDGTSTTYVYDYANRLIALGAGGATTTYGYDWAGKYKSLRKRERKRYPKARRRSIWDKADR
jgi:YD repeat-containing protein